MLLNLENLPRTIWVEKSGGVPAVGFVDQRLLPGELILVRTSDWREVVDAVKTLAVRGAPAIGVAGAAAVMLAAYEYAVAEGDARLAAQRDCEESIVSVGESDRATFDDRLEEAARVITGARPTAVNLSWGVRRAVEAAQEARSAGKTAAEAAEALYGLAGALIAEDEAVNRRIGAHGAMLLREIADKRDGRGDAPEASHGIDGSSRVAAAAQTIDGYDAVPASRLNGKADDLMPSVGKDYRLRKALEAVSDRYDFAILDTPPALDTLTVNALTAASWVVIPAQADAYSLDGVTDLAATIQAIREYTNPDLKIAGILLMRYNPRTPISKIIREDAEAMAAELDTKVFRAWIREATVIKESQAVKQSLFAYAPSAKVAYDYRFFIEELLEDING